MNKHIYAMVMHDGSVRMIPKSVTYQDRSLAVTIIASNGDGTFDLVKDRFGFGLRSLEGANPANLTREQADTMIVQGCNRILKYSRA